MFSSLDLEFFELYLMHDSTGWFLSAYFLGGYGDDGRGMNGLFKAFIAATKSWALGIPVSFPSIFNRLATIYFF